MALCCIKRPIPTISPRKCCNGSGGTGGINLNVGSNILGMGDLDEWVGLMGVVGFWGCRWGKIF